MMVDGADGKPARFVPNYGGGPSAAAVGTICLVSTLACIESQPRETKIDVVSRSV